MPTQAEIETLAHELTKKLADQGRLIEIGWVSLRSLVVSPNASQLQLDEMRMAFMCGAQHLFASIMGSVLDPGDEPTPDDMRRMELIEKELDNFRKEMELRMQSTKGSA